MREIQVREYYLREQEFTSLLDASGLAADAKVIASTSDTAKFGASG
jgi:hypothetical protein